MQNLSTKNAIRNYQNLGSFRSDQQTLGEQGTYRTDQSYSTLGIQTIQDSDQFGSNELPAIQYTIEQGNLTIEGENCPKRNKTFKKLKEMVFLQTREKEKKQRKKLKKSRRDNHHHKRRDSSQSCELKEQEQEEDQDQDEDDGEDFDEESYTNQQNMNYQVEDSPVPPPEMLHSMLSGTLQRYQQVPSVDQNITINSSTPNPIKRVDNNKQIRKMSRQNRIQQKLTTKKALRDSQKQSQDEETDDCFEEQEEEYEEQDEANLIESEYKDHGSFKKQQTSSLRQQLENSPMPRQDSNQKPSWINQTAPIRFQQVNDIHDSDDSSNLFNSSQQFNKTLRQPYKFCQKICEDNYVNSNNTNQQQEQEVHVGQIIQFQQFKVDDDNKQITQPYHHHNYQKKQQPPEQTYHNHDTQNDISKSFLQQQPAPYVSDSVKDRNSPILFIDTAPASKQILIIQQMKANINNLAPQSARGSNANTARFALPEPRKSVTPKVAKTASMKFNFEAMQQQKQSNYQKEMGFIEEGILVIDNEAAVAAAKISNEISPIRQQCYQQQQQQSYGNKEIPVTNFMSPRHITNNFNFNLSSSSTLTNQEQKQTKQYDITKLVERQSLQIKELYSKLNIKTEELSISQTRNFELQSMNDSLEERVKLLNSKIHELQDNEQKSKQLVNFQQESVTMVEQLKEMLMYSNQNAKKREEENKKLDDKLKSYQKKLQQAQGLKSRADSQVKALTAQIQQKNKFIEKYKNELIEIKELMQQMSGNQNINGQSSRSQSSQSNIMLSSSSSTSPKIRDYKQQQQQPARKDQGPNRRENASISQSIISTSSNTQIQSKIKKLRKALQQSEAKRIQNQRNLLSAIKYAEDFKAQLKKKVNKVKDLKDQRDSLKTQNIKMKQVFTNKCESYQNNKNKLNKKINDRDATIAALQQKLKFYENEHQRQQLLGSLAGSRTTGGKNVSSLQMILAATAMDESPPPTTQIYQGNNLYNQQKYYQQIDNKPQSSYPHHHHHHQYQFYQNKYQIQQKPCQPINHHLHHHHHQQSLRYNNLYSAKINTATSHSQPPPIAYQESNQYMPSKFLQPQHHHNYNDDDDDQDNDNNNVFLYDEDAHRRHNSNCTRDIIAGALFTMTNKQLKQHLDFNNTEIISNLSHQDIAASQLENTLRSQELRRKESPFLDQTQGAGGVGGMILEPNLQKKINKNYVDKGAGKNLKKIVNNKLDTLLNEVNIIDSKQPNQKKPKLPPKTKNSKNEQELIGTYNFQQELKQIRTDNRKKSSKSLCDGDNIKFKKPNQPQSSSSSSIINKIKIKKSGKNSCSNHNNQSDVEQQISSRTASPISIPPSVSSNYKYNQNHIRPSSQNSNNSNPYPKKVSNIQKNRKKQQQINSPMWLSSGQRQITPTKEQILKYRLFNNNNNNNIADFDALRQFNSAVTGIKQNHTTAELCQNKRHSISMNQGISSKQDQILLSSIEPILGNTVNFQSKSLLMKQFSSYKVPTEEDFDDDVQDIKQKLMMMEQQQQQSKTPTQARKQEYGTHRGKSSLVTKQIDISSQASGSVGSRKNISQKSKKNLSRNNNRSNNNNNNEKKRQENQSKLTETLQNLTAKWGGIQKKVKPNHQIASKPSSYIKNKKRESDKKDDQSLRIKSNKSANDLSIQNQFEISASAKIKPNSKSPKISGNNKSNPSTKIFKFNSLGTQFKQNKPSDYQKTSLVSSSSLTSSSVAVRGFTPPANISRPQNQRKSSLSSQHSNQNQQFKKPPAYGRVYERNYVNKTLSRYIAEQTAKLQNKLQEKQQTPDRFNPTEFIIEQQHQQQDSKKITRVGKDIKSTLNQSSSVFGNNNRSMMGIGGSVGNQRLNQSAISSNSKLAAIDTQLKKLREKWGPKITQNYDQQMDSLYESKKKLIGEGNILTTKYASRALEMTNNDFISKLGGSIRLSPSVPSTNSGSRVNTQGSLKNSSSPRNVCNKR